MAAPRAIDSAETPLVADLLRRVGFGSTVGRLLELPLTGGHGVVFVVDGAARPVGTAACVSFGDTGWIGAVGVDPAWRRQRIAMALTSACVEWLRGRGANTIQLYATESGRPLYKQLGFVANGSATAWRGTAAPPRDGRRRALRDGDRDALTTLDHDLTGERREVLLAALRPLRGLAMPGDDDGRLDGVAIPSLWGAGVAIMARDEQSGLELMAAACSLSGPATLIVPDHTRPARDAVMRWRFARYNTATRMALGPEPPRDPATAFGLFNLFWG